MRLPGFLAAIPRRAYLLCFIGTFIVATAAAYFTHRDTGLLEKRILSKQQEISHITALKETYEAKKQAFEASGPTEMPAKGMSLTVIEEIASRTLKGGRLVSLRPAPAKTDKEKRQMAVEVKISSAPLAEVISFLQAVDYSGFRLKKLQLSLQGIGQTMLEMQASLIDGRTHE